ncbi:unnamed protein product, partial [Peniophora sp. CBMAI 1063]
MAPPKRNSGGLNLFLARKGSEHGVPVEVMLEILRHLRPVDLLHISRANKAFNGILLSRELSGLVWAEAFKRFADEEGGPPCPTDMIAPAWAGFAFGGAWCTKCGGKIRGQVETLWELRARLCIDCGMEHLKEIPTLFGGGSTRRERGPPVVCDFVRKRNTKTKAPKYGRDAVSLHCWKDEVDTFPKGQTADDVETRRNMEAALRERREQDPRKPSQRSDMRGGS